MTQHHRWHREWRSLFDRLLRGWNPTPVRVMLLYYVFGLFALYFSDVYLVRTLTEPFLSQVQAAKGFVEVLFTGVLVFVLTAWSRAPLEHTTDTLERQREELNVLHRVLRHNFRNDLNVLYGFVDTPSSDTAAVNREQAKQKIDDILHDVEQMNRIRRITAQNGTQHTFEFPALAEEIVENNQNVTETVDVDIDIEGQVHVAANHMLPDALDELLTNAVVHAETETAALELTVSDEQSPLGYTTIAVSDDGPGVPDEVLRVLETTHMDQLTHLDGMGLWFVLLTVSNSDGELNIESTATGTTVRITVPKVFALTDGGHGDAPIRGE